MAHQTEADPVWPFVQLLHGRVTVEDLERASEEHWSLIAKMARSPIPDERIRTQAIQRIRNLSVQRQQAV